MMDIQNYTYVIYALVSSLTMGSFYIMDMFFESRGVYSRPSQAMIISSIVPLLSVPIFILSPWWHQVDTSTVLMSLISGAFLIWANWFYFLVMFPVDKDKRGTASIESATELSLYEGSTPVIVLVIAVILSQFGMYQETISIWSSIAVIMTVASLLGFALSDGYQGFAKWSYRFKLLMFATLASISQLVQDVAVAKAEASGLARIESSISVSSFVWLGMFTGVFIIFWKKEGKLFAKQWNHTIKKYIWFVLFAEFVAIGSYAALIGSYAGEHVAVSGAIASSFPIVVFIGGLILQEFKINEGSELAPTSNIGRKLLFIIAALISVIAVIIFQ